MWRGTPLPQLATFSPVPLESEWRWGLRSLEGLTAAWATATGPGEEAAFGAAGTSSRACVPNEAARKPAVTLINNHRLKPGRPTEPDLCSQAASAHPYGGGGVLTPLPSAPLPLAAIAARAGAAGGPAPPSGPPSAAVRGFRRRRRLRPAIGTGQGPGWAGGGCRGSGAPWAPGGRLASAAGRAGRGGLGSRWGPAGLRGVAGGRQGQEGGSTGRSLSACPRGAARACAGLVPGYT